MGKYLFLSILMVFYGMVFDVITIILVLYL
nr:MAG TPA: hypothetical protein [Caudoviricetes sp.]